MTEQDQARADIAAWLLHVCQDYDQYRGEGAQLHAERDATSLYESVVGPLLAQKDEEIAELRAAADDWTEGHRLSLQQVLEERDMALRLHAEAVWNLHELTRQRDQWWEVQSVRIGSVIVERDQLLAECARLRREVEIEANGVDLSRRAPVGHGYVNGGCRCECGEPFKTLGEWLEHCKAFAVCSCAIDFAVLDPDRFSRPVCAVHPDGQRWVRPLPDGTQVSCPGQGMHPSAHPDSDGPPIDLGWMSLPQDTQDDLLAASAVARDAADSGERHSLDEVAAEFGVPPEELSSGPCGDTCTCDPDELPSLSVHPDGGAE